MIFAQRSNSKYGILEEMVSCCARSRFNARSHGHRRDHASILIHQPSMSGLSGQATDIDIHAKEILRMRSVINQLLADHSGQPIEKIEQGVERDFIMSAPQAKEYGLIDEIIHKHR
jgi:ATP-dependent Clp endopeptidase proteolytic subunit ClpP